MTKANILFIDDDKLFLEGVDLKLRNMKKEWSLDFAYCVDEALNKMSSKDYDVVVSDAKMPEKSGFDFLRIVKENESLKDIPTIILTGNLDISNKKTALDLGATDLLNKPVSTEDLLARIKNLIELKKYHDLLKNQNAILEEKVEKRTEEVVNSRMEIVWRLAKAGEYRDEDTGKHIIRVGLYSNLIAKHLSLTEKMINMLTLTSPLHDIGKIGISDAILLKPDKLTNNEFDIMKRHSFIGYKILSDEIIGIEQLQETMSIEDKKYKHPIVEMAANIALNHHEKWDGTGYPNGLRETEIPIEARITAVADVYDALRSRRPYKDPFSEEKTKEIILQGSGNHFDPDIVAIFNSISEQFDEVFSLHG